MKLVTMTALFVAIFAIGFGIAWVLQKENLVDACLDAGGRWEQNGYFCQGL